MLDIKMIRQNTDEIKERLATRGVKAEKIDALLEKDKRRRELLVETEGLKQKRNEVSAEIANAKRNKQDATDAIKEMREGKQSGLFQAAISKKSSLPVKSQANPIC